MKIILFDIDGTIVKPGARLADGSRLISIFGYSLNKVFGVKIEAESKDIQGCTDKGIFLDVAEKAGISRAETEKHMDELVEIGTQYIRERIEGAAIVPTDGVKDLLEEFHARGYHMGLLTGNIKKVAEMKLTKIGVWGYFEFGGFGTLSEIRSKLIDYAVAEAEDKFKTKINRREVFYFGDAPRDIAAGKEAGVVNIDVATGIFSVEQLSELHPDYVLPDLKNTKEVIELIEKHKD